MDPCPHCGAATEEIDRFCAVCGAALGEATGVESNPGEVEILTGAVSRPATAGATTRPRARWGSPRTGMAVAGAVFALVVGAWAVGRAGPEEGTDPGEPTSSPDRPAATSDRAGAATDPTTTDGPTTDGEGEGAVVTYGRDSVGPVFGRPVGWSLLIGNMNGQDLQHLDLDTGRSVTYPAVPGGPLLVVGDRLVMMYQGSEDGAPELRIVPLAAPADGAVTVPMGRQTFGGLWPPVVPGPEGHLWAYQASDPAAADPAAATVWRLIRLADGAVVDEVPAAPAIMAGPVDGGGPDIASSGSGGVYRRDGDRDAYRLLAAGTPITVRQGAVLTRTCASPTACQLRWLDVDTGQPVPRSVPSGRDISWMASTPTAGRFLLGLRWRYDDGSASPVELAVFDVDRARPLVLPERTAGETLAASPDGRFLAIQSTNGIALYDADQDRWVMFRQTLLDTTGLVFVASGGS